jgi:enamine deaminase RidA (YjgF/YER057c/UK114 family)
MSAETRLIELNIQLPAAPTPAGLYAPCVQSVGLLYISGQIPTTDGKPAAHGKLGAGIAIDQGAALARNCTLNALAIAREHLGSLDRITRVVRVGAFVASAPNFTQQPEVANGASQLLIDLFGEEGRHARAAVGVAELPRGVPVEVEFIFEVEEDDLDSLWANATQVAEFEVVKSRKKKGKGKGKAKKKGKK